MMLEEFEKRTGYFPTMEEYAAIEKAYMEALPHVAVKIPSVPAFQLFVDSRHMHAERVGYILRAFSFEIAGLQRLAVCQRQISVVSHVLTSLWCGCILRPFCKICIYGRVLLVLYHRFY